MKISYKINFSISKEQVESFKLLSGDLNPLHSDEVYASKTNFGQPVVFGVSTFLAALSIWSKGKNFAISSAKIFFKKPLFVNQEYRLNVEDDSNGKAVLEICRGNSSYGKFSINYVIDPEVTNQETKIKFFRKNEEFSYEVKPESLENFYRSFGYRQNQLPLSLLIFLSWSSFYVGMVNPGEQALFTQLSFSISGSTFHKIQISLEDFHPVFQTATINAVVEGFSKDVLIKALSRPPGVKYSLEQIREQAPVFSEFEGKTFLITGASRGFGSVLSKLCLSSGANVVAVFRNNSEEMKSVQTEAMSSSGKIFCVQADLSSELGAESVLKYCKDNNLAIDFVVNNAVPAIYPYPFSELEKDFKKEFLKFLDIGLNTTSIALKVLTPGGVFVNISTSYIDFPVADFSHYISSKAALEFFLNSLALEYPDFSFFNYRLPKMLTDQTNIAFQKDNPVSPIAMASALMKNLEQLINSKDSNNCTIKLY